MLHISSYGVLNDVKGDHFPIYICVKKPRESKVKKQVLCRTYTAYDKGVLQNLKLNDDWLGFYAETDPNILWRTIKSKIDLHLNIISPFENLTLITNKPCWLSHHIIESIKDRVCRFWCEMVCSF